MSRMAHISATTTATVCNATWTKRRSPGSCAARLQSHTNCCRHLASHSAFRSANPAVADESTAAAASAFSMSFSLTVLALVELPVSVSRCNTSDTLMILLCMCVCRGVLCCCDCVCGVCVPLTLTRGNMAKNSDDGQQRNGHKQRASSFVSSLHSTARTLFTQARISPAEHFCTVPSL